MSISSRIVAHSAAIVLFLAPRVASGQAPAPEWFAGGSLGMVVSRGSEPEGQNPSVRSPAVEGSALEGSLTVGAFATPRLGFSAELGMPASFDVQQTWGRDATTWDNQHRDVTLAGLALLRGGTARVQITGAAGAGSVWSRTTTVTRFRRFGQRTTDAPFSVATSKRQVTDLAFVAGAELSVPLSARVRLGPAFRVTFVRRDESNEFEDRLPTVLYQVGASLRVRLR